MSIKETSRVWETSKQDSTALLLLLAFADCADDWGHCWPGRKFLAKHARCDIATVSRLVAKLIKDNELCAARQKGRGTHYVILCGLPEDDQVERKRKLIKLYPGSDLSQLPTSESSDMVITRGSDIGTTTSSDIAKVETVLDPSLEPSNDPVVDDGFNVFTAYQKILGRMINSPYEQATLEKWEETYPAEWITDAMIAAARNQAYKPLPYIDTTLLRWRQEGKDVAKPSNNEDTFHSRMREV